MKIHKLIKVRIKHAKIIEKRDSDKIRMYKEVVKFWYLDHGKLTRMSSATTSMPRHVFEFEWAMNGEDFIEWATEYLYKQAEERRNS